MSAIFQTLASDLDEKKPLYAAMGMPEYCVIDVQAKRMFVFLLQDNGIYQESEDSQALVGLTKDLLEQTLMRTKTESNGNVAMWFAEQIALV